MAAALASAMGDAAPRLNDLALSEAEALQHHATLIGEVVRMLCAGVIWPSSVWST